MSASSIPMPSEVRWGVPLLLIALTFLSTLFAGAGMVHPHAAPRELIEPGRLLDGWVFAVPLMGILLAHEFGHYIAGRKHSVDVSPPYFLPMPFFLFGTLGAVIRMRSPIRSRNALLDIGAAGPLAGLAVAIPVLAFGLAHSPVEPLPESGAGSLLIEGKSILYMGLLEVLKGPIPAQHDVRLSPTAIAGWAGLLVTMINLLPVGQLDGGHVAYALLGPRQDIVSERVRRALPLLALGVGLAYGIPGYLEGKRGVILAYDFLAGVHWLVWAGILALMTRLAGAEHPPTGPDPLTPRRRRTAIGTLLLFLLLLMPSWLRVQ